jgi:hypothetical protein
LYLGLCLKFLKKKKKKRYEGNICQKNKGSLNSKERLIVTSNRYAALGADNLTLCNEDGTHSIYCKNIPSRKETQVDELKHRIINCPVVDATQPNLVMMNKDKHNLYNQYPDNVEAHHIPTIINGQILEKEGSTINLQGTKQQRKSNRNTARETSSSAHKIHNILIIGDSHNRGLALKIQNCLDDSFKLYGLTNYISTKYGTPHKR